MNLEQMKSARDAVDAVVNMAKAAFPAVDMSPQIATRDALNAQIAEAERKSDWPKVGGVYWSITGDGIIYKTQWHNSATDRKIFARGNVFRTREAAEKVEAYLRSHPRLLEALAELGEPKDVDIIDIYPGRVVVRNSYNGAQWNALSPELRAALSG